MIVGNFYVIHCYNNIKEMKKKKLLWICLVFLLIIGGIEIVNFKFKLATHGDPVARYHQPSNFSN
ncbi:hypothetical protein ACNPMP_02385, partial [Enterococcus faecium]|uniref:hypothetical protein n=1 Tax=Enterococcus faecium TaxID=1352 RepID=UPI003AD4F54A